MHIGPSQPLDEDWWIHAAVREGREDGWRERIDCKTGLLALYVRNGSWAMHGFYMAFTAYMAWEAGVCNMASLCI